MVSCVDPMEASGPQVTSRVVRRELPLATQPTLDLLFVVDSSPAMAPHRVALLDNAARFIADLETSPGGLPDLHIGVATTDVGTRGADDLDSQARGDCSADGDAGVMLAARTVAGNVLTDARLADGTRQRNYAGTLAEAFTASVALAGTTGCSFPRPLEAMRRALESPVNAGFRREHAYLGVVFLTSQDDCSFSRSTFLDGADPFSCISNAAELVSIADYAGFLKSLTADPAKIVVAGAFGPSTPFVVDPALRTVEPSCTIDQRSAKPGVRLQAFLDQFPNRSSFTSLCQSDLSEALEVFAQLVKVALGVPCFEVPIPDADLATPGDQFDCAASLRHEFADHTDERVLPECASGSAGTCWRIDTDQRFCPSGTGQLVRFDHAFSVSSRSSRAIIECVVQ